MHHASNQSQPLERMGQAIIGHSIRHEISFGLDFLATIAHGYAHSTVFKHRNVYLGITKGNGVLNPATDMLQHFINDMGLLGVRCF